MRQVRYFELSRKKMRQSEHYHTSPGYVRIASYYCMVQHRIAPSLHCKSHTHSNDKRLSLAFASCGGYCNRHLLWVFNSLFTIPYTTAYITPRRTDFPWFDISTVGTAPATKKIGVGNISPTGFGRRFVRCWHPLGCREIELGKPPQGGSIYTSYTRIKYNQVPQGLSIFF